MVSEGASTLVLESEAHATARKAKIFGWLLGGAYVCDGSHMSQPRSPSMVETMKLAMSRAAIDSNSVGYINAHATGTKLGDPEEARAIFDSFSDKVPTSSLKEIWAIPWRLAGESKPS